MKRYSKKPKIKTTALIGEGLVLVLESYREFITFGEENERILYI